MHPLFDFEVAIYQIYYLIFRTVHPEVLHYGNSSYEIIF